jgi:hypothetical protein
MMDPWMKSENGLKKHIRIIFEVREVKIKARLGTAVFLETVVFFYRRNIRQEAQEIAKIFYSSVSHS